MDDTQTLTKSEQKATQVSPVQSGSVWHPLAVLRNEMDRLFDSFWRMTGAGGVLPRLEPEPQPLWRFESSFGLTVPNIDLVEREKEFLIKAELPGMDASNVELAVSGDVLTIKGEKKDEREEKGENFHLSERRFGSFRRSLQLHPGIDPARIEASFDKGVLTVTLPKSAQAAAQQRKIAIKQAA
jgi:HSP20 family protein